MKSLILLGLDIKAVLLQKNQKGQMHTDARFFQMIKAQSKLIFL